MKRCLAFILVLLMILPLVACQKAPPLRNKANEEDMDGVSGESTTITVTEEASTSTSVEDVSQPGESGDDTQTSVTTDDTTETSDEAVTSTTAADITDVRDDIVVEFPDVKDDIVVELPDLEEPGSTVATAVDKTTTTTAKGKKTTTVEKTPTTENKTIAGEVTDTTKDGKATTTKTTTSVKDDKVTTTTKTTTARVDKTTTTKGKTTTTTTKRKLTTTTTKRKATTTKGKVTTTTKATTKKTTTSPTAPTAATVSPTTTTTTTITTTTTTTTTTTKTTTTTRGEVAPFAPITIKAGSTPVEKGLNFGGKTYKFAYYGASWDQDHTNWHNDFQKDYNVKLDIDAVPTSEYVAHLSSALASGKPYDVVFLYSFNYPEQIVANVMKPLEDYITTADMWDSDSATTGGYSYSLAEALSLNGHIYCVAGNYLQTPTVIWYNKKEFAKAGFTGAKDPLAMYNSGKWNWQELYDMLYVIQKPENGVYGINSIAPYWDHQFINSFNTDLAKLTNDGRLVENLSDPNLYAAYEMLQKFCYGEHKVANPKDIFESGYEQFFNGTTVSLLSTMGLYWTAVEKIPAASAFDKSLSNLGVVPLPTYKGGPHSIYDWMGYGAGNGASEEGTLCALAFAKHDSIHNHKQAYHPNMPADMKKLSCGILDSDNLIGPKNGFESSAGSLGGIGTKISTAVAINGRNITVTLKGYKKMTQTVIDTALKG